MEDFRRNALKKLGVVTGVGAFATTEWAKPVLNKLVVPAHAATTSASSSDPSLTASVVAAEHYPSGSALVVFNSSTTLDNTYTAYFRNASDGRTDITLSFNALFPPADFVFDAPPGSTTHTDGGDFTADIYINSTLIQAGATIQS